MDRNSLADARTSFSHPLQIAELSCGRGRGRIGITLCPGKRQCDASTGVWERDLDIDLDLVVRWGASAVVTLIEDHELRALGVERLGTAVRERHMDWFHLPVRDVSVPGADLEEQWAVMGPNLRSRLRQGFDILVHCKGGLGRAGTIAARLMAELGTEPAEAIRQIRLVRPGAIETPEQEVWVLRQTAIPQDYPPADAAAVKSRARGSMIGLAVGDALGTTLEFAPRDSYPLLTDMVGGGPFNLKPGEWTDDTSMALALGDSLASCGYLDEYNVMIRWERWRDDGAYSSNGRCFDIGATVSAALDRWCDTANPIAGSTNPATAGNGSLMRIAPVSIRYWDKPSQIRDVAARQSMMTHAAPEAVAACAIYAEMIGAAISGRSLGKILRASGEGLAGSISGIVGGSWRGKARQDIHTSGYVAHSLEAALWCRGRTGSFSEAVLTAANLGEDADTTAAITGQLAGAVYGEEAIPLAWRQRIVGHDMIRDMADRLLLR
ncbi:ADP-ribosyl-[dinitrogen reductase] hydrolase [Sphingobium faniae]|nr:ADP-ribosyl-[dinitrogen reductase] hydrolase [Sphingobium faniae]